MNKTPRHPLGRDQMLTSEADPVTYLVSAKLLRGVKESTLRRVEPAPEWKQIYAGELLLRQGDDGEDCFFLVRGRLRVSINDSRRGERMIGYIQAGEAVGEMALLTNEPRSANVRAVRDSKLIRFSRDAFLSLLQQESDAALTVSRTIIERLKRELAGRLDQIDFSTIAILPISPGSDVADFATRLKAQLKTIAPSTIIGPDGRHGPTSSSRNEREFADRLYASEQHHRHVLFQCEYGDSHWNRLCLRQADLILGVADVNAKSVSTDASHLIPGIKIHPASNKNEQAYLSCGADRLLARVELVMLHGKDWTPHCGTEAWLAPGIYDDFHHVRCKNDLDFARLARLVTGRGINVVLGGGGARGFAQIGVLRAIVEAGIPIDRIAGTSMGSLLAAQYSLGYSLDEMLSLNRSIWVDGRPLSDFTFPLVSFVRGRRLQHLLFKLLNPWQIEDMPIRFFCVSSSLSMARLCVHDRGVLWRGVRASGSIPGIGPPMINNGELLIDGGVLNNLPGNLMGSRFNGRVIVIDVAVKELSPISENWNDSVISGWKLLWRRLNPLSKASELPSIMEILYRTVTLSSERLSMDTIDTSDFVFTPPVKDFGLLAFDRIEEIAEAGYRYARKRLEDFDFNIIVK